MNRLFLILDLLDFKRESLQILADIIEDEGDSSLAQRTRMRKFNQRKVFHLALELIPFEMCVVLGIEFFQHSLSFGRTLPDLDSSLEELKEWIRAEDLKPLVENHVFQDAYEAIASLEPISLRNQLIGRGSRTGLRFIRAQTASNEHFKNVLAHCTKTVQFADDLIESQSSGNVKRMLSRNNAIRRHVQSVAAAARELSGYIQMGQARPRHPLPYPAEQLSWQVGHLKKTIQEWCE